MIPVTYLIYDIVEMMQKILGIIAAFGFFILVYGSVFETRAAESDFSHNINASYYIEAGKTSKVEYVFQTTNKVDNNYLQTFSFKLPFEPKNISAEGSSIPVKVAELKKLPINNIHQLSVEILNPVYGVGKSFEWRVKFDVEDLAFEYGKQKAVVIPAFNDEIAITDYAIKVNLHTNLGPLEMYYGYPEIQSNDGITSLTYSKKNNRSSNLLFLLGSEQYFAFNVPASARDHEIYLPEINSYQSVYFTDFPKREFQKNTPDDLKTLTVRKDEVLSGNIRLKKDFDKKYVKTFSSVKIHELATAISKEITDKDNTISAKNLFYYLQNNYSVTNYLTDQSTKVRLDKERQDLNPAEINQLFRDVLTLLNIENRGVYGYVTPIQAQTEQSADTSAQEHIWSEFWDGTKWVSADLAWIISSKGTDYFEKNHFHHVKFGNYNEFEEILNFFGSNNILNIALNKNIQALSETIDINLHSYTEAHVTREWRISLENKSQRPIFVDSIKTDTTTKSIRFENNQMEIKKMIYPNSKVDVTVPLSYGLLLTNKNAQFNTLIRYSDLDKDLTSSFNNTVRVRSNYSSVFIYCVFIGTCTSLVLILRKYRVASKSGAML